MGSNPIVSEALQIALKTKYGFCFGVKPKLMIFGVETGSNPVESTKKNIGEKIEMFKDRNFFGICFYNYFWLIFQLWDIAEKDKIVIDKYHVNNR